MVIVFAHTQTRHIKKVKRNYTRFFSILIARKPVVWLETALNKTFCWVSSKHFFRQIRPIWRHRTCFRNQLHPLTPANRSIYFWVDRQNKMRVSVTWNFWTYGNECETRMSNRQILRRSRNKNQWEEDELNGWCWRLLFALNWIGVLCMVMLYRLFSSHDYSTIEFEYRIGIRFTYKAVDFNCVKYALKVVQRVYNFAIIWCFQISNDSGSCLTS